MTREELSSALWRIASAGASGTVTEVETSIAAVLENATCSAPQLQPIESAPKDDPDYSYAGLIEEVRSSRVGSEEGSWGYGSVPSVEFDTSDEKAVELLKRFVRREIDKARVKKPGTQPQGCSKCEEMRKALFAIADYEEAKSDADQAEATYGFEARDGATREHLNELRADWTRKADRKNSLLGAYRDALAALSTLKKQEEQS
jgi:hypothetical protein